MTTKYQDKLQDSKPTDTIQVTVAQLYKQLQLHDTLILTCTPESVPSLRKRLSKRKYLEGKKLGDYADKSLVLSFVSVAIPDSDLIKLHVSLKSNVADTLDGIAGITAAATLSDIAQGIEPMPIVISTNSIEEDAEVEVVEDFTDDVDWDEDL